MEDREEDDEEQGEVYDSIDPEEAIIRIQNCPSKPTQKEVDEHYASHLPYRSWCPICVQSRGREDGHKRIKKRKDGKPRVVLDYKEFGTSLEEEPDEVKLRAIVMRNEEK